MDHSKKKDGESLYHVMLAGSLIFFTTISTKTFMSDHKLQDFKEEKQKFHRFKFYRME